MIELIAKGELEIITTTTSCDDIPAAIEGLKNHDMLGRIVAVMD